MWTMIKTLVVENYRSFPRFELGSLGRVNLLVGMNNSGKTSLLEAIQVVMSNADSKVMWSIGVRRGESARGAGDPRHLFDEVDLNSWFHGFELHNGSSMTLSAALDTHLQECRLEVVKASPTNGQHSVSVSGTTTTLSPSMQAEVDEPFSPSGLMLSVTASDLKSKQNWTAPLSTRGGVQAGSAWREAEDREVRTTFVPTNGISTLDLVSMIDDITLTDEEALVLQALQSLDDRIERFAPKDRHGIPQIVVRLKGAAKPLPIGVLGDGVNRLLTIAVALAKSAHGILLIDEIDTGLHHTTMDRMWSFIRSAAEKLNVQVFATTHSRDCYESLATICQETPETLSNVSIQRIEQGRQSAVSYSEAEILAVARRGLEVR